MKTEYINRLSVPMRAQDNVALTEVRAALERKFNKRLSNAEAIRLIIKAMCISIPKDLGVPDEVDA